MKSFISQAFYKTGFLWVLIKVRHCSWIVIALLTQLIDYIDNCKHFLYYKFSKMLGLDMQMSHDLMKYAPIGIHF